MIHEKEIKTDKATYEAKIKVENNLLTIVFDNVLNIELSNNSWCEIIPNTNFIKVEYFIDVNDKNSIVKQIIKAIEVYESNPILRIKEFIEWDGDLRNIDS